MEENENNTLNNGGEEVKKDLTPPEGEPVSSVEAPVSASLEKEATIEQDGGCVESIRASIKNRCELKEGSGG